MGAARQNPLFLFPNKAFQLFARNLADVFFMNLGGVVVNSNGGRTALFLTSTPGRHPISLFLQAKMGQAPRPHKKGQCISRPSFVTAQQWLECALGSDQRYSPKAQLVAIQLI